MKKDVVIPRLGSSDESDEVKVIRWLKRKGETVKKGEPLLEVKPTRSTSKSKPPIQAC